MGAMVETVEQQYTNVIASSVMSFVTYFFFVSFNALTLYLITNVLLAFVIDSYTMQLERLSGDEKNDQKLYAIVKTLNEMLIKKSTRRDRQSVSLKPRRHFTSYI